MSKAAFPLTIALLAASSPGAARDFSCRNEVSEVRCVEGECEVATSGFTPMQLTRSGGTLQLCAYSGCWEGPIRIARKQSGIEFLQARVKRDGGGKKDWSVVSVMFSEHSGAVQLHWGAFVNVLGCASR